MDFMTIKQASEKWGICTRRVQTLCTEGRIDGAERLGHQWVIPIIIPMFPPLFQVVSVPGCAYAGTKIPVNTMIPNV